MSPSTDACRNAIHREIAPPPVGPTKLGQLLILASGKQIPFDAGKYGLCEAVKGARYFLAGFSVPFLSGGPGKSSSSITQDLPMKVGLCLPEVCTDEAVKELLLGLGTSSSGATKKDEDKSEREGEGGGGIEHFLPNVNDVLGGGYYLSGGSSSSSSTWRSWRALDTWSKTMVDMIREPQDDTERAVPQREHQHGEDVTRYRSSSRGFIASTGGPGPKISNVSVVCPELDTVTALDDCAIAGLFALGLLVLTILLATLRMHRYGVLYAKYEARRRKQEGLEDILLRSFTGTPMFPPGNADSLTASTRTTTALDTTEDETSTTISSAPSPSTENGDGKPSSNTSKQPLLVVPGQQIQSRVEQRVAEQRNAEETFVLEPSPAMAATRPRPPTKQPLWCRAFSLVGKSGTVTKLFADGGNKSAAGGNAVGGGATTRKATDCLNGMRVLSMLWIILGHTLLMPEGLTGYTNPEDVASVMRAFAQQGALHHRENASLEVSRSVELGVAPPAASSTFPLSATSSRNNLIDHDFSAETSPFLLFVLAADFGVDSFFFMSGFLLSLLQLKEMQKRETTSEEQSGGGADQRSAGRPLTKSCCQRLRSSIQRWLFQLIQRYIRLTPSLAFVLLLYYKILYYYVPRGPFTVAFQRSVSEKCDANWWSELTYTVNFIPFDSNQVCMGWTWYLGNDMMFFAVGSIVVPLYFHKHKHALLLLLGLLGICIGVTTYLIFHYHLGPYIFDRHYVDYSYYAYSKPYCRIGAYLIGIATAWHVLAVEHEHAVNKRLQEQSCRTMFLPSSSNGTTGTTPPTTGTPPPTASSSQAQAQALQTRKRRHSSLYFGSRRATFFLLFGIATILFLILVPSTDAGEKKNSWNDFASNLMLNLGRIGWAFAVGIFTTHCYFGKAPLLDSILGHSFWLPVTRLCYGAYLCHPLVIKFFAAAASQFYTYSVHAVLGQWILHVVLSFALSVVVWCLIERPVITIATELLTSEG
ncbi:unnamed protein product [Amoebophrya sp. A25]|nr:unnamed protein product [Amoebophrya sp. A25]|eukprot:GSA25T00020881001.1